MKTTKIHLTIPQDTYEIISREAEKTGRKENELIREALHEKYNSEVFPNHTVILFASRYGLLTRQGQSFSFDTVEDLGQYVLKSRQVPLVLSQTNEVNHAKVIEVKEALESLGVPVIPNPLWSI